MCIYAYKHMCPNKPCDDTMIVNEPVKPVAGSSKHPDDMDDMDGELIY